MKLYTDSNVKANASSLKLLLSVGVTQQPVQIVQVQAEDTVVPYLVKSKLPVLEIQEGDFLFSFNSAAKYLFLKANKVTDEDAENETLYWDQTILLPSVERHLTEGQDKKGKNEVSLLVKLLEELDTKLSKSKYLVGENLGASDVCVFCTILPLLSLGNQDLTSKLTNLKRWIANIRANQVVQSLLGDGNQDSSMEHIMAALQALNPPVSAQASGDHDNSSKSADQAAEKISQEDVDAAIKAWKTNPKDFPKQKERKHPILPEENVKNILITSALPYVNNVPHLGNIIGCVLSADVFSRFARLRNYNVLYVCGTDEYGTATETKAMEEGVTPQEICDKYHKLHVNIYKWFNIDFDIFGRTTTRQQTEISQDIFWKLHQGGYIFKDSVEQLHCGNCDRYLADRFVEGTCPLCNFNDARGDQCDSCGKLINAIELKDPKCKICRSSPSIKTSQHLFLDLPKLEPKLQSHLNEVFETGTWTSNAKVITTSWIRDGLKARCITRDLKWGTPVPLEGYTNKVFYVWFDAPIGYVSITANYTDQWEKWWKNPKQVSLYNFLGKDNVPFHSVIFPSCLLGANDNYTVVNSMIATEYLNYEDTKFSKSRNTGVFGDDAETTGIPADVYRFYLLFVRPESQDTVFSWDDFQLKINSELLNNLGNFINRALSFLNNNFGGVIQEMNETEADISLISQVDQELKAYVNNLDVCRLRDGIRNILSISRLGNQYVQNNKPWVLAKGSPEERKRAGTVVSLSANVACLLSVLLQPYMPATSSTIQQQLQAPATVNVITGDFLAWLRPGHKIGTPIPLFQKIESSTITELKSRFAGKTSDRQKQAENKPEVKKTKGKKGTKQKP